MKNQLRSLLTIPAALGLLSTLAAADVAPGAGSLLIFPEFDNSNQDLTLLTVTNTSQQEGITVHFEYVNSATCLEFNRELYLTADDTVSLLTSFHNPFQHQGYVYAYAQDANGQAVVFDWLIGSMLSIRGIEELDWSVNAFTFKGIGDGQITDLDGDNRRDLDGVEYEQAFDSMLIPRFVATGANELILVNLTGGSAFQTIVDFAIYNDNEDFFSGQYQFYCWERVPLLTVAPTFNQEFLDFATDQDPSEFLFQGTEYGWMRIEGLTAFSAQKTIEDPAILAVLVESRVSALGELGRAASLPFTNGPGRNGSLLPHSPAGDNSDG